MRVKVNGVDEDFSVTTVGELLVFRGIDPTARFLAVAVNGCVVRRSEWPATPLRSGDDVEIVRPFSGG